MKASNRVKGFGLVLVGLLVGMLLITPATAHFTTNTKHLGKHAWKQFIKQRVYTKKQANNRFYTKNQADSQFLGSDVVVVRGNANVAAGARGFVHVQCPSGYQVISGGVRFSDFDNDHYVNYNGPAPAGDFVTVLPDGAVPTAWQGSGVNGAASTQTLFVWALCSKSPSAAGSSVAGGASGGAAGGTTAPEDRTAAEIGG